MPLVYILSTDRRYKCTTNCNARIVQSHQRHEFRLVSVLCEDEHYEKPPNLLVPLSMCCVWHYRRQCDQRFPMPREPPPHTGTTLRRRVTRLCRRNISEKHDLNELFQVFSFLVHKHHRLGGLEWKIPTLEFFMSCISLQSHRIVLYLYFHC